MVFERDEHANSLITRTWFELVQVGAQIQGAFDVLRFH
jgi:hypothetical protein